jgi:IS5 family transposase
MLLIRFMQQWLSLFDPAMAEAFFVTPLNRDFAKFEDFGRLPDESTILRFCYCLEKYMLAEQYCSPSMSS